MSNFLGSVWWLVITLGVLVTFHEFGHFWVGRRFGVKVLRFSVGFGKPVWSRRGRDGTEYAIAAIPLGGYVKFLDEREAPVADSELDRAFNRKPVWQRFLIVAAGPLANLVLCVLLLWSMLVIGRPDYLPRVGQATGLAAEAGFRTGDRLLAIDGTPTPTWNEALLPLVRAGLAHRTTEVEVTTPDATTARRRLHLERLPADIAETQVFDATGLLPAHWMTPPVVGRIESGSAADGRLQAGDRILAIDGVAVANFESIGPRVQASAGAPVTLSLDRHGNRIDVHATPRQTGGGRWLLGVGPAAAPSARYDTVYRLGPLVAVPAAFRETGTLLKDSMGMLARMVQGRASSDAVSGPITIARVANDSAQMGPAWFLRFLALMSLSLAVLNLLPIPILDGGHLLFFTIEALVGHPLGERALAIGQAVGGALLLGLMGLAFYNDILGLLR